MLGCFRWDVGGCSFCRYWWHLFYHPCFSCHFINKESPHQKCSCYYTVFLVTLTQFKVYKTTCTSSRPCPLFYTRVHFINLYRKHKQSIITLNVICNKYDMVNPTVVFLINIEMVGVTGQWMIAKDIQNKNADAKFSVHDAFLNKKNALMTLSEKVITYHILMFSWTSLHQHDIDTCIANIHIFSFRGPVVDISSWIRDQITDVLLLNPDLYLLTIVPRR